MATWDVEIIVTNLVQKRGTVSCIRRADGEKMRHYSFKTQYDNELSKAENLTAWGDQIWQMYLDELAKEAANIAFVDDMEGRLADGLNEQED